MATLTRMRRRRSRYNALPRWVTRKRVILTLIAVVVVGVGQYGVRFAFALAHAFHTNPVS
ncbi:MAG: hypothetical protein JOY80_09735, partial [Candidatus Dormibacteraeota bacterium]|nr:hypothetical protein [Candidatus Dormibacteraeota bacterium]